MRFDKFQYKMQLSREKFPVKVCQISIKRILETTMENVKAFITKSAEPNHLRLQYRLLFNIDWRTLLKILHVLHKGFGYQRS